MICQALVSMCQFNNSSEETQGETLSVLFMHKASTRRTTDPFANIYTMPLTSTCIRNCNMYLLVKVTEEVDLQIILKYVNKYHHQKEKKHIPTFWIWFCVIVRQVF